MKPSTISVFKQHGWRVDRAIHHYFFLRFYAPYIKVSLVSTQILTKYFSWLGMLITPIGKAVFHRYHSKVLRPEQTKKIFTLNKSVDYATDMNKRIVPYKYATRILFQDPEYIVVMDCPCKRATNAPNETVNSCIAVGKGISRFWLEHCQKYNPRKINQEAALEIIDTLRTSGHLTQAFFKVATGGRTGVICNCHPDTCVSLIASRLSKKISPQLEMNAESGFSIRLDKSKCDLNGKCVAVCPVNAIQIAGGVRTYDKSKCLGCELCVEQCAPNALTVYKDPQKTWPLDIEYLENNSFETEN